MTHRQGKHMAGYMRARESHDKPGTMTMPNYKIKDMKQGQNQT